MVKRTMQSYAMHRDCLGKLKNFAFQAWKLLIEVSQVVPISKSTSSPNQAAQFEK
jgi:hypothetical protein